MSKQHALPTDYDYDLSPSYLPKHLDSKPTEVTVTPAEAELLLSYNSLNRRVSPNLVKTLADAFATNDWQINGETIKVANDKDGRPVLIDGQHRCLACIKADVPMRTYIIRDLPLEAFDTIDSGKRRSNADIFSAKGYDHSTHLAATLNLLNHHANDRFEGAKSINNTIRNERALDLLAEYPGLPDTLEFLSGMFRICPLPVAIAATGHYLFKDIDPDAADLFMTKFCKGISIDDTSPIYHFREMMLRQQMDRATRRRSKQWSRVAQLAGLITTWNKFRTGKPSFTSIQMWYPGKSSFPQPRS